MSEERLYKYIHWLNLLYKDLYSSDRPVLKRNTRDYGRLLKLKRQLPVLV